MQSEIQKEVLLMLNVDNVAGTESVKILAICSQVLSSDDYVSKVKDALDIIFNQPTFEISSEIGYVVSQLINLNKNVLFYKTVAVDRMKYVLYSVIYQYMLKQQTQWLNSSDIGNIRLLFCNVFDLLMIKSETLQMAKAGCFFCIAKSIPILSNLVSNKLKI